jgi:hypothetical protein
MAGSGAISRLTGFSLKTGTGGDPGPADPARFTGFVLLPNGNPRLELTGTASRAYTIERSPNPLPLGWTVVGTVTMDATGKGSFEDGQAGKAFPLFYRAVAN